MASKSDTEPEYKPWDTKPSVLVMSYILCAYIFSKVEQE